MNRRLLVPLSVAMLLSVTAWAQTTGQYLDVFMEKVKPDRRADFDAIGKKIAEANRKNHGDTWVAMETTYGENNAVTFISTRGSYADIEKGSDAFMGALVKAYGEAGAGKLMQDDNNTLVSSRGEVRRRRWDLSANVPGDPGAIAKMIGEARWLRTIKVRIKPGRGPDFEALLLSIKAAEERSSEKTTTLVSQAVAGQEGTVYYITWLVKSLGDFDGAPNLQQLLGDDGFQNYLKVTAESVQGSETVINHFLPELSNPPADYAAASPAFWTPKPKPAAKAKPKAEGKGK